MTELVILANGRRIERAAYEKFKVDFERAVRGEVDDGIPEFLRRDANNRVPKG